MTTAPHADGDGPGDIAQLAKGGRTNFFGFLLRLAARLPFLFIAGRWYGADVLGPISEMRECGHVEAPAAGKFSIS